MYFEFSVAYRNSILKVYYCNRAMITSHHMGSIDSLLLYVPIKATHYTCRISSKSSLWCFAPKKNSKRLHDSCCVECFFGANVPFEGKGRAPIAFVGCEITAPFLYPASSSRSLDISVSWDSISVSCAFFMTSIYKSIVNTPYNKIFTPPRPLSSLAPPQDV